MEFWIEIHSLYKIMAAINYTLASLQGKQLILDMQKQELERLREELMRIGGVTTFNVFVDDLENPIVFDLTDIVTKGSFTMTKSSAQAYLNNLGDVFIVSEVEAYRERDNQGYTEMLRSICKLFVELVHGLFVLCPERDICNSSLCRTPPPIMPYAVVKIGSFHLSKLVIEQKERLHASFNESKMREIEIQYSEFETRYYRDKSFKQIVDNTEDTKSFHEAWGLFYKDYPSLVSFFGGLATLFPGTSTVESDFSTIGWERDVYRSSLASISVEGILHSKQYDEVADIRIILNDLKG
jgi:hypothetical protein